MKVNTRLEKLDNPKFLTENKKQNTGLIGFLFHIISLMLPLFALQYNYCFCAHCTQNLDVFHLCCGRKQFLIDFICLANPKPLNSKMLCLIFSIYTPA